MNRIEVKFTPCTPAPTGGYNIQYRVAGTTDLYTDAGNFFISPAVFYDTINPVGTNYEGYIRSKSGDLICNHIPWTTVGSESGEDESTNRFVFISNPAVGSGDYFTDALEACSALGAGFSVSSTLYSLAVDEDGYLTGVSQRLYTDAEKTIEFTDSFDPDFIGFRIIYNLETGIYQVVDYQSEGGSVAVFPENC